MLSFQMSLCGNITLCRGQHIARELQVERINKGVAGGRLWIERRQQKIRNIVKSPVVYFTDNIS